MTNIIFMISREELQKLLLDLESARVERTISTKDTDKFGQAICAFANDFPNYRQKGYLIIGVDDRGNRNSLHVTDKLLLNLAAIRSDGNIIPPPAISVEKFVFDDGEVAIVEVSPHTQPPVRYKGKVWIRNGPRKAVANESEEKILSEKRSSFARNFETEPCHDSSLESISEELFKLSYLPTAIDQETLEANHRDLKLQLASLKFYDLKADTPTHVGVLLFNKNPRYFLPGAYIQFVKFNGLEVTDEIDFAEEFSGDMINKLNNLDNFIKYQIIKKGLSRVSTLREETISNYPSWAIRELLLNAIIHRDYQSNTPIKFYQFDDRIEITNPGGLYGEARPENFPNINAYRNPELASVVKNLGYVNKFNVGIKRAQKLLIENGNPTPEFTKNEQHFFSVKIFSK
ncbi:MAG: ATP-binding protein [Spirochaetota bacterium]